MCSDTASTRGLSGSLSGVLVINKVYFLGGITVTESHRMCLSGLCALFKMFSQDCRNNTYHTSSGSSTTLNCDDENYRGDHDFEYKFA